EAAMDGYQVMPLINACQMGEVFITATGNMSVIDKTHFLQMRDGAIVANSGHFNVEINIPALESMAKSKKRVRPSVDEYVLGDGRRIYLLGEGRLINLAAAEGHPASVMDMSFANQALCLEYLVKTQGKLEPAVYPVPEEIDQEVGRLKLASMNVAIDSLSEEQRNYLASWEEGT
ncbi:MAG: adenosylhomocysteinase, partial [Dehalococcoidia bacterium]|nr:adenosylhomocysteinase [Dehalococcoidia bacterium]